MRKRAFFAISLAIFFILDRGGPSYGRDIFSPPPPSAQKEADDGQKQNAPYWLPENEKPESAPYWQMEERDQSAPYWQVKKEEGARPYWLPQRPEPEPVAAPPPPPSADGGKRLIEYYMYQDERGVKHLTNAPVDPRYRLFTVEVRVSRGLAPKNTRFTHETLRPYIMEASRLYGVEAALIAAVIKSESAFDTQAVSWAGAKGLMQLMPATAREMGCRDPFDPRQNILGGSRYLALMLNRFGGDMTLALAAYNAGPERVARNMRVPGIPETRNYVLIVQRNYERYLGSF